jgi:hypothetical protein
LASFANARRCDRLRDLNASGGLGRIDHKFTLSLSPTGLTALCNFDIPKFRWQDLKLSIPRVDFHCTVYP